MSHHRRLRKHHTTTANQYFDADQYTHLNRHTDGYPHSGINSYGYSHTNHTAYRNTHTHTHGNFYTVTACWHERITNNTGSDNTHARNRASGWRRFSYL